MANCTILGCTKQSIARGWCFKHYQRWKFHGDPNWQPPVTQRHCNVDGCVRPHLQKGFCRSHYMRWYRHGDPLKGGTRLPTVGGVNNCQKETCPAASRLRRRLHYQVNKEDYLQRANNRPSEVTRVYKNKWKKNNGARVRSHTLARKRGLKQATPNWLTDADWVRMNALYTEARRMSEETGVEYHVDHIFPLRGQFVSGLHVPGNLRVMSGPDNMNRARIFSSVEFSGLPTQADIDGLS